jgi:hypothetical protein
VWSQANVRSKSEVSRFGLGNLWGFRSFVLKLCFMKTLTVFVVIH